MSTRSISDGLCLVTGAGGFIGSHLVEALIRRGCRVRAFLRYNSRGDTGCLRFSAPDILEKVELVWGDLRDAESVRRAVEGCEVVFHLGALIAIPYSYHRPSEYVQTNVVGTANLLGAAGSGSGVGRIVVVSTSEVYGSARYVPIDEDHPLCAQSPYAATKVAAEALSRSYYASFGTPAVIVRPFNAFGPRQTMRAVIPMIVSQAVRGSEVTLGSLFPSRDFTYVEDTVAGLIRAGECPGIEGEVINLGTGHEISVGEVVDAVSRVVGRSLRVRTVEERVRPEKSEVTRLLSSTRKAREVLKWASRFDFLEGLRRTVVWIEQNLHLYGQPGYVL